MCWSRSSGLIKCGTESAVCNAETLRGSSSSTRRRKKKLENFEVSGVLKENTVTLRPPTLPRTLQFAQTIFVRLQRRHK
ncbi:hypothetical protein HZ326_12711 [Fusarium oxysporum f. sp. albedinis]|nr:hypothetical protein HZ326_12711 [Fusarium oxysporum f. sp. albedinis]